MLLPKALLDDHQAGLFVWVGREEKGEKSAIGFAMVTYFKKGHHNGPR